MLSPFFFVESALQIEEKIEVAKLKTAENNKS